MATIRKISPGFLLCFLIALPSWLLGQRFPLLGGAVIAILSGMLLTLVWPDKGRATAGIRFCSKLILQLAVVLLGFGLNLQVVLRTGRESLPIILATISVSLFLAWFLQRYLKISRHSAILVGVGSSICGGSAIAATAPILAADDDDVAQAVSVIFFFNVLAAILFPLLGRSLGMDTGSGEAFGIFAGTAVNDTSSVTAAAATWDSMWNLGTATLDKAVTVKLTRTLAIIPITLGLAYREARYRARTKPTTAAPDGASAPQAFSLRRAFPLFILFFILASVVTTLASSSGVAGSVFQPLKNLSKFLIVMAMAAIGLNSNVVKLLKNGGRPLLLGACCWLGITVTSLVLQALLGLW